jgi:polyisoprenoid-binding protein YceI
MLFTSALFTLTPALATAKDLTLDPNHSYVQFHINHFGFSNPSGKWLAEGKLVLDEAKPQNSTLNVTINVASVETAIPELNKHLNSELFFNTKKFPTATFVSNKIDRTGKESALIHGTLTLHGVSKPVTLKVKLNKKGINPINNKLTYGFTASTTLKRSDFGMKELLPGLGNEVKLDIEAEAS